MSLTMLYVELLTFIGSIFNYKNVAKMLQIDLKLGFLKKYIKLWFTHLSFIGGKTKVTGKTLQIIIY